MAKRALTEAERAASRRLAEAIKASPLSQAAIGDAARVSQGQIWQWANEHLPVPAKRAKALADVLGCRPEEISVAYRDLAVQANVAVPSEETEKKIRALELEIRQHRAAITALVDLVSSVTRREEPSLGERIQAIGLTLESQEFLKKLIDLSDEAAALPQKVRDVYLQGVAAVPRFRGG